VKDSYNFNINEIEGWVEEPPSIWYPEGPRKTIGYIKHGIVYRWEGYRDPNLPEIPIGTVDKDGVYANSFSIWGIPMPLGHVKKNL